MASDLIGLLLAAWVLIAVASTCESMCFSCFGGWQFNEQMAAERRTDVDENLMSEVYEVIDRYLIEKVKNNDPADNLPQVKRLLDYEMDAKPSLFRDKHYVSKHMPHMDRSVIVKALQSLDDLNSVLTSDYDCSIANTHRLIENNRIAKDAIGRLTSDGSTLFPRIDNVIFFMAHKRASRCLQKYVSICGTVRGLHASWAIRDFWNPIFEHRFKKAKFDHWKSSNMAFYTNHQEALQLIESTPHALQQDEMRPVVEGLEKAALVSNTYKAPKDGSDPTVRKFEHMLSLCSAYVSLLENTFKSLDFDLLMKKALPKEMLYPFEHDHMLYQQRAYYSMCQKLINEKDRFAVLLRDYKTPKVRFRV